MKKFLKKIDTLDEWIAFALFVVMCCAVAFQMVMRIAFKSAPLYTEEIARFSYIWIVFLCLSISEKYSDHFCVEVFLKFLKGVPDKIVRAIAALLFVWIYIYLFYWSLKFFNFQASVVSAAMEIPMSVVALGLCVGFALEIIRCSIKAVNCLRSLFKKGKEEGI